MRQNLIASVVLIALLFTIPVLFLRPEKEPEEQDEAEVFPQVEPGEMDASRHDDMARALEELSRDAVSALGGTVAAKVILNRAAPSVALD